MAYSQGPEADIDRRLPRDGRNRSSNSAWPQMLWAPCVTFHVRDASAPCYDGLVVTQNMLCVLAAASAMAACEYIDSSHRYPVRKDSDRR